VPPARGFRRSPDNGRRDVRGAVRRRSRDPTPDGTMEDIHRRSGSSRRTSGSRTAAWATRTTAMSRGSSPVTGSETCGRASAWGWSCSQTTRATPVAAKGTARSSARTSARATVRSNRDLTSRRPRGRRPPDRWPSDPGKSPNGPAMDLWKNSLPSGRPDSFIPTSAPPMASQLSGGVSRSRRRPRPSADTHLEG
jgi:hypothetical protein